MNLEEVKAFILSNLTKKPHYKEIACPQKNDFSNAKLCFRQDGHANWFVKDAIEIFQSDFTSNSFWNTDYGVTSSTFVLQTNSEIEVLASHLILNENLLKLMKEAGEDVSELIGSTAYVSFQIYDNRQAHLNDVPK